MSDVPLILVVGGDALAVRVCEELCSTEGHRVALVWPHEHELAKAIEAIPRCEYLPFSADDYDALKAVGVMDAISLMALADDDRLNLQVALKARDLNAKIRIVLRQFNRKLARKLEQNLPNCSVLALASHAAATIVGASLDRSCFYALQYPDLDGELCGFAERPADGFGISGLTWREAQTKLGMRVIALAGAPDWDRAAYRFAPEDLVVVFGRLQQLVDSSTEAIEARGQRPRLGLKDAYARLRRTARQTDPVVKTIVAAAVAVMLVATAVFTHLLHKDVITSLYFVLTTMTSTGYGDITPLESGPVAKLASNALMIVGLAVSGIFIALATTALTRAQWVALQGLRQIHTTGHTIVCGAGNVGTRVIEYLKMLGQSVVVVDPSPEPEIVELSRVREIELMTGDATRDGTLDLCHLVAARSLIALTNSDTANLEIALGARGRNERLDVVMRVQEDAFAASIARQFSGIRSYSTSALAAPALAGLARFPGTRARIAFGNEDYNVGERQQGEVPMPPPADHCIALAVWRNNRFLLIDEFGEMEPFDRLLFIVPLSQFRKGTPPRERMARPFATVR